MYTYKNRHYVVTIHADITLKEAIKIAGLVLEETDKKGEFIGYVTDIFYPRQIKKRFKELGYSATYRVNENWIRLR